MSKEKESRRNDEISVREVRVIDEAGEQLGVMLTYKAIEAARDKGLDLVEVAPQARPPVCKMMDYGKYVFQKNKTQQAARKKQKITTIKEIKFRPNTEKGDYDTKMRHMLEFLEDGDKLKVTMRFRGREMAHQELGLNLLMRVRDDLAELAQVEQMPKLEGRQMVMAPKKK